ncbi:MAG: SpoIIE family protein phosphatase [Bryobacteraceae bacterium]
MTAASLLVVDPDGHRARVPLEPLPFRIGRQPDNHLVLRDSRASRNHARIVFENGEYAIEDVGSRYGVWVNGRRVERELLRQSDRIDFGVEDSYHLIFVPEGAGLARLAGRLDEPAPAPGMGANLARLRAVLDIARELQAGFSIDDVLRSVVDAALAVTGAERGFLLLRSEDGLEVRVARSRGGVDLPADDLRVPRGVIARALDSRHDLLSMNFDPLAADAGRTVADLELRSVICVPLVRVATVAPEATSVLSAASNTAGVLYMDSRVSAADMTGGNRELLQALAIEASTVLENARLLEQERLKRHMEEELAVARDIQQSLLPRSLPSSGWFRAAGSSVACHQVGGDYYDVIQRGPACWSVVVADVSGKGVSSALLASLLQGAMLTFTAGFEQLGSGMSRLNHFLNERTGGEKYATVFYCVVEQSGCCNYINAGHCAPLLLRRGGETSWLEATGTPLGLIDPAEYASGKITLAAGDKIVIFSDGVTETRNPAGEFYGRKRLRQAAQASAGECCGDFHRNLLADVMSFAQGEPNADDLTLLVLEYAPPVQS